MRTYIVFLAATILAANAFAAETAYVLYLSRSRIVGADDLQEVFRVNLDQLTYERFYYVDPPPMPLSPVVSPTGDLVAIPCMLGGDKGFAYIDIVNADGERIHRIEHASPSLAWSSDGLKLAYVSFSFQDGEEVPTGIWLYDMEERSSTKVHDVGFHLTWARFNGKIYLSMREDSPPILELDSETFEVIETGYKSLHFSPDGQYYFYFGDGRNQLVLREDGTNISAAYEFLQNEENFGYPEWLSNDVVMLGPQAKKYHDYIFSCTTGRAYMVPGQVLALAKNGASVYISRYPDGAIEKLPFDKLELKAEGESPEAIQAKIEALRHNVPDSTEEDGEG